MSEKGGEVERMCEKGRGGRGLHLNPSGIKKSFKAYRTAVMAADA